MKQQRLVTGILAALGMLILIMDGKTAINGAKSGMDLCFQTVIPSLFPFFILSGVITESFLGVKNSILSPLGKVFGVPSGAETLLIPAFLGGYPAGAQAITQAYQKEQLRKSEAERLLAFCNNAGPSFIFGIAASSFSTIWYPCMIWIFQIASAFVVAQFFIGSQRLGNFTASKPASITDVLNQSILAMAKVCSWIILFRVILVFGDRWFLWILPREWKTVVYGVLELSNGCCSLHWIADEKVRFIVANFLITLGGLCVIMQICSVITDLSPRVFILGKIVQALFSLFFSALFIYGKWYCIPLLIMILSLFSRRIEKICRNPQKHVV